MMEPIVDQETGEIISILAPFTLTPQGLGIQGDPTIDDWIDIGHKLKGIRSATQWAIGDWINYGESRVDWGEKYDQALSQFDYDYGYLRNLASIAKQYPFVTRRVTLTWSHHAIVAPLEPEEREQLLLEAENDGLSRDDLRDKVKGSKPPKPQPPAPVLESAPCRIVGTSQNQVFLELSPTHATALRKRFIEGKVELLITLNEAQ